MSSAPLSDVTATAGEDPGRLTADSRKRETRSPSLCVAGIALALLLTVTRASQFAFLISAAVIVLGIDPGTAATGYGVVQGEPFGSLSLIECGVIRTHARELREQAGQLPIPFDLVPVADVLNVDVVPKRLNF